MAYPLIQIYGISSPYGQRAGLMGNFHHGTDMPTPIGIDVPAVAGGDCAFAGWITFTHEGVVYRELIVIINRADGFFNVYGHLSTISVSTGSKVSHGQIVGKTGASGYVTGPHLHLEKRIGRYTGGLISSYSSVNPETELLAWTAQGGSTGGNDVTPEQAFADVYIAIAQQWPGQAQVDAWKASGMTSYAWCQKYAPNPAVNDGVALRIYHQARIDAGHGKREDGSIYPADQFAADRLSGGDTFEKIITGDMGVYLGTLDSLQGQLNAANQTNASLRANIQEEAQKLASEQLIKVQDEAFKAAYRTQSNQDPAKTVIEQWKATDLSADEWVRKFVPNADTKAIQERLDASSASVRRLNETIEEQKRTLEQLATEVGDVKEVLAETEAEIKTLTVQRDAEYLVSESLRTELKAEQAKSKPVHHLTIMQLITELLSRLTGGAKS